jgi:hypothetical protein
MAKILGKLMVDKFPDGTVRLLFIPNTGDSDVSPLRAETLDAAEVLFMTYGLSAEQAAVLRAEVQRNWIAIVETIVDEDVAMKFRVS